MKNKDKYEKCWKYLLKNGWLLQEGVKKDLIHAFKLVEKENQEKKNK